MKLHNYESLVSCNYACMFSPFSDRNLGVDSNLIVHFMYQKIQCIYFLSDYIFSKCSSFTKIILPICLLLFLKRRIIPSKHFSHYLNSLPLVKITKLKKKNPLKNLGFFSPLYPLMLLVWIYQMKDILSLSAVLILSTHSLILMLSVEEI